MNLIADSAGWWVPSVTETLLVAAVVLVLLDIFFQSDIPTHIAYILIAIVVATWIPVPPLYQVVVGMLAWFALVWGHYKLWRYFLVGFVNRVIAPTKYKTGAAGLVGSVGTIKEVNGKKMVSVQGDLWLFESANDPAVDAQVEITAEHNGVLKVAILKEET